MRGELRDSEADEAIGQSAIPPPRVASSGLARNEVLTAAEDQDTPWGIRYHAANTSWCHH